MDRNLELIGDVIENLKNLEEIMSHLERKEDGSIYSLMKSNIQADLEKLETVRKTFDKP